MWFPKSSPDGSRVMVYNGTEGTFIYKAAESPWRKEGALHIPKCGENEGVFLGEAWSPGGERITGDVLGLGRAIYSLDSGECKLLEDLYECEWIDERRMICLGDETLAVLDTASGERTEIDIGEVSTPLQLSPDERTLYYRETSNEADIWLATLE